MTATGRFRKSRVDFGPSRASGSNDKSNDKSNERPNDEFSRAAAAVIALLLGASAAAAFDWPAEEVADPFEYRPPLGKKIEPVRGPERPRQPRPPSFDLEEARKQDELARKYMQAGQYGKVIDTAATLLAGLPKIPRDETNEAEIKALTERAKSLIAKAEEVIGGGWETVRRQVEKAEGFLRMRQYKDVIAAATRGLDELAKIRKVAGPLRRLGERLERLSKTARRQERRAAAERRIADMRISVQGIIREPGNAVALINGKVMRPGDRIGDAAIEDILGDAVILVLDGVRVRKKP